jgi:hypothetical protein
VESDEEFIPRPQNDDQKKVGRLIGEMSGENSKRLGMDRRDVRGELNQLREWFRKTREAFWSCSPIPTLVRRNSLPGRW